MGEAAHGLVPASQPLDLRARPRGRRHRSQTRFGCAAHRNGRGRPGAVGSCGPRSDHQSHVGRVQYAASAGGEAGLVRRRHSRRARPPHGATRTRGCAVDPGAARATHRSDGTAAHALESHDDGTAARRRIGGGFPDQAGGGAGRVDGARAARLGETDAGDGFWIDLGTNHQATVATSLESIDYELVSHVYVHVPFCQRRCSYCDFSIAVRRRIPAREFVDAILAEFRGADRTDPATIYFGGGTPSLLPPAAIAMLLAELLPRTTHHAPRTNVEITLEAN